MTELEMLIDDNVESIRNLKIGDDDKPLTDWGNGYNQGIDSAANVAERVIRLILLKAKNLAVR